MNKKIISATLVIVGFVLGATALSALADWTAPGTGCTPPSCNTDAPINASSTSQSKLGPLSLNTTLFNPATIGLTVFGKVKIFNGDVGAGKIFTDVLGDGVGTWQDAKATFCNSAVAQQDSIAVLSLLKNGVNICKDTGGCTIKVSEIKATISGIDIVNSIIDFAQLDQAYSTLSPNSTVINFPVNSWANGGINGDMTGSTRIYTGVYSSVYDDYGSEVSPDEITLVAGHHGFIKGEVCDF